jgi:hypothetical protein
MILVNNFFFKKKKGTSHPAPEQVYNLEEAQVSFMIGHTVFEQRINELVSTTKLPYLLLTDRHFENVSNNVSFFHFEKGG